jgi:hypothetical protein
VITIIGAAVIAVRGVIVATGTTVIVVRAKPVTGA